MSGLTRSAVFVALASCLSLLFAGSAWASTMIGQSFTPDTACVADTFFQSGVASGTSYTVPAAGVITFWYFQDGSTIVGGLKLKVGHPSIIGVTIVGDSAAPPGRTPNQLNGPYATRIPVVASDVLGIYTNGAGLCSLTTSNPSDTFFQVAGDPPPNTFSMGSSKTGAKFPVEAIVEPDADSDGFGDESQDFCDTDGTTQGPCRSPGSLTFGSQAFGTQSPSQTVTLSNTRTFSALSISSISAGGDFVITSNNCGTSIGPQASCQVGVMFAPTGLGARSGRLSIADAGNGSPHTVALSGTSFGCVVPNLKRKKLKADRRSLIGADCSLGRVRGHGKKVKKQSVAPGTVLPPGSPVNVKLGS